MLPDIGGRPLCKRKAYSASFDLMQLWMRPSAIGVVLNYEVVFRPHNVLELKLEV